MKNKMTVLDTFLIENCMAIFGLLAGIAMPKEKRKTAFTVGMAVFLSDICQYCISCYENARNRRFTNCRRINQSKRCGNIP